MGKVEGDVSPQTIDHQREGPSPAMAILDTMDETHSDNQSDNDGVPKQEPDVDVQEGDAKQAPTQKRRRVTRACDECRRKKIKCDGRSPCTHCTVYSYDCTYDQPSNRRRNPAPQYIEALEQRLARSEGIIRALLPGFDSTDPKLDGRTAEQILEVLNLRRSTGPQPSHASLDDDAQMRSMVDRTGSLDLDDTGFYDYHGNSSGYNFVRRFRAQFGDDFLPIPQTVDNRVLANLQQSSPKSQYSSPMESNAAMSSAELPPKHVAIELCRNAIDDCCALQRPLHRPTFFARLETIYSTDPVDYTSNHLRFLPSLYAAMAVGCLFGRAEEPASNVDRKSYSVGIERGYQYFNAAKSMLDISDCRDIVSIQSVMFMILFLQGTAKLATCYAYIGVALRACCRLGMHRRIAGKFNMIEQEERKRLFWQIRKLDIYVGAMLGLPQMLSNDDIDQDPATEVVDEAIGPEGLMPTTQKSFPLIRATNAHTKLVSILQKVCRYVYPVKAAIDNPQSAESMISHSRIRELERDLQEWMDELPVELRPTESAELELARVQQLLRMSYAYVQMMIYRPFLHYVGQACQTAPKTDKRSFACAAACVSVSRNVVHITSEMKRRGLLMGAYWFVMYTTYFAILSLLYFVLENPESPTSKDILRDAVEGRDTLANLAQRSLAADRCSSSLAGLFEALPEKLNERRSSIRTVPNMGKKRPPPSQDPPFFGNTPSAPQFAAHGGSIPDTLPAPNRARTMPQEFVRNVAKRMSMPEPPSAAIPNAAITYTPDSQYRSIATPSNGSTVGHSQANTPATTLDFGTPALVQGQLPDLKSVMFPGDNPFAYPKQPISTLDMMPDLPLGEHQEGAQQYNSPMTFESQHFPQQNEFHPRYPQQGNPLPQQQYFDYSMSHEPSTGRPVQAHESINQPPSLENNDYWSHAPAKGHFRTGLTPGGPGINLNLDDIFGNAQGWSVPMNLTLPDNIQQQQQQQQQQPQRQPQNMHWAKQNGQDWQGYRMQ